MDLRSGAVIAGRYRVDRKVGAGGMGEVWEGDHIAIGSRVALKTMLPAVAVNHEVVARFKREAFLLGKVRSDYVARVVDFVADDKHGLVLVMEFIHGESLARLLMQRVMTIEETVDLGYDLANALCDLHRAHIVHRDLKPGNVILSTTPDGHHRAVLVDFGVSRMLNDGGTKDEETITGITRADMAVGTIEYMSPEQILNSRSVTGASDIYAVGAMLFRAASGQHVYGDIENEAALAQMKLTTEAPPVPLPGRADRLAFGLREAIGKALKRRPAERVKTAEELLALFAPLRDLARVNALDLDATTQDVHGESASLEPTTQKNRDSFVSLPDAAAFAPLLEEAKPTAPAVAEPPRTSMPSATQAGVSSEAPSRRPPSRGVPLGLTVGAVVVALAGGAVVGATFIPEGMRAQPTAAGTAPAASAPPKAQASAPEAPPEASAAPQVSAAPEEAAPSPSAGASAPDASAAPSSAPATSAGQPASAAREAAPTRKLTGKLPAPAPSSAPPQPRRPAAPKPPPFDPL